MSHYLKKPKGVVALITLLGLSTISLAIISSLAILAISELRMANSGGVIDKTYYAAETGLNEGLYRLIRNPGLWDYSFELDNGVQVTVSTFSCSNPECNGIPIPNCTSPKQRVVCSQAEDSNGNKRTVAIVANTSSFAGGFDFAVQGGSGGIEMDNNSCIKGNIYSEGNILVSGGGNGCKQSVPTSCREVYPNKQDIIGDVTVAFDPLNPPTNINGVRLTGDARAHKIIGSTIGGQAYYQELSGTVKANGGGEVCKQTTAGTYCHPGSVDPEPKEMPIKDEDIQNWKDEITAATAAGNPELNPDPTNCSGGHVANFYCVENDETHGYQKIVNSDGSNADFYVGNNKTLTLTGNLWITGEMFLDNNGTIKIDETLCNQAEAAGENYPSFVIITDGIINVNENYTFKGCQVIDNITGEVQTVSYILIVSMSGSLNPLAPAILASNNSNSIIFAAINGMLRVKENGCLNAAASQKIHLEENSTVTYNPLLSSFVVGSGGGEEIGTSLGSWQEL